MNDTLKMILNIVVIPLLPAVVALLGMYMKVLTTKLKREIENETANHYIDILERVTFNVVQELNQTLVDTLKARQEGKLSSEEKQAILQSAKLRILNNITATQREVLETVYGDLDGYLDTLIESKVRMAKQLDSKNG